MAFKSRFHRSKEGQGPKFKTGAFTVNGEVKTTMYVPRRVRKKLREILQKGNIALLCGIVGSGRTTAAEWYGSLQQKVTSTSMIWKVSSGSIGSIYQHLMELYKTIGHFSGNEMKDEVETKDIVELLALINRKLDHGATHVLIFEDIDDTNLNETIKCAIRSLGSCNNVKCIVTTQNRNLVQNLGLFNEYNTISEFTFSESDVKDFFDDETEENTEMTIKLAKYLSFHPFALKNVRSNMRRYKLSAKKMLDLLYDERKETSESEVRGFNVFSKIETMLKYAEEQDKPMYDILLNFYYFEKASIPFIIINYLDTCSCSSALQGELRIHRFIEFVEQFSFGSIHGKDDDRRLDLLPTVYSGLKKGQNKATLIKVLKSFAQLMCKEHDQKENRKRCVMLLPHAKSALDNADESKSVLESLCKIMVSERLFCIFRTTGQLHNSQEQCRKSVLYCHDLLGSTLTEIGKESGCGFLATTTEDMTLISHKVAAKMMQIIQEKLIGNNDPQLTQFPTDYILMKYRHAQDEENIKKVVPSAYSNGHTLKKEEYNKLIERGCALDVQPTELVMFFIIETFISSFLAYGSIVLDGETGVKKEEHLLDAETCVKKEERRKRLLYVYIAFQLGQLLENQFPDYPSIYAFNIETTGVMEIVMSNKLGTNQSVHERVSELKGVEGQLHHILEKKTKYFYNGLSIRDIDDPNRNIVCRKQLLKCCQILEEVTEDEKEEYRRRADHHANEMEKLLLLFKNCQHLAYNLQEKKQFLVTHFMKRNEYARAAYLLETFAHVSYESLDGTVISPKDMKDWELSAECFFELKRFEKLSHQQECLQRLQENLDQAFFESNEQFKKLCDTVHGYLGN